MDRATIYLIGRKHSRKDRQVNLGFRELKAEDLLANYGSEGSGFESLRVQNN